VGDRTDEQTATPAVDRRSLGKRMPAEPRLNVNLMDVFRSSPVA
jgi:hypothetical protein